MLAKSLFLNNHVLFNFRRFVIVNLDAIVGSIKNGRLLIGK